MSRFYSHFKCLYSQLPNYKFGRTNHYPPLEGAGGGKN
jgi:hypothetical protein